MGRYQYCVVVPKPPAETPFSAAVGVDLGGTKAAFGVVSAAGEILERSTASPQGLTQDELIEMLVANVSAALGSGRGAGCAGLGIPARINRARGYAIDAVNLPLREVPIRDLMSERLGVPVTVDNDGNCAMFAEHRIGAAKGATNAVLLTLGTGIGGGLILGGEIFRGSTGAGAELGHIPVQANGPPCQGSCPGRGCVETLASGTAIGREGRLAAKHNPGSRLADALAAGEEIDGPLVSRLAHDGDEAARQVLADAGRYLGYALVGLANTFEPDVIVIGGGAAAAGELLLEPARDVLRRRALTPQNQTPIVDAALGPEAGLIGAALMAIEDARK